MANRRIEMHQYRQVIHCMRLGQSDRAIARDKLIGRRKCAIVRVIAEQNGWLSGPLPDDEQIAIMLEAVRTPDQNQPSLRRLFRGRSRMAENTRHVRRNSPVYDRINIHLFLVLKALMPQI